MSTAAFEQDLFAAAVKAMPDDALSAMRQSAAERFAGMGFPTSRDENWKYTNLSGAIEISNEWLRTNSGRPAESSANQPANAAVSSLIEQVDAHWLVIRNGRVDPGSLEQVRENGGPDIELDSLTDKDDQIGLDVHDPMSAFNAALLKDGLYIRVRENGSTSKPIGILQIDDPSRQSSQARVVIELAASAILDVVECAMSEQSGSQFSNSVTQAHLAAGANLKYVRLQLRDDGHVGVNRLVATLDRDAHFTHNAFDFGGSLTRNDVVANIAGRDAEVNLLGLYLGSDNQHIDNHTRVEHRVGPAVSHEEYRGVLNGRARGVFNGQAIVFEGADGTDASQSNHNLLLSDRAEIDTKPELEIYADDVKCSHGATVGQLDEASLFYLRSRGLGADEARHLLTQAFAASVLGTLAVNQCRDYLTSALDRRLSALLETASS